MLRIFGSPRLMLVKLVLFGSPESGRRSNLEFFRRHLDVPDKDDLTSIRVGADTARKFEFTIPDVTSEEGFRLRFQVFTTIGRPSYQATHELMLRNCDGVILVVDSDRDRVAEQRLMIQELAACLASRTLPPPAFGVQFNKRDLDSALPVAELTEALEIPAELASFEATANRGIGVFETFNVVSRTVLDRVTSRETPTQAGFAGAPTTATAR